MLQHIRRLQTIYRYVDMLPGDAEVNPNTIRHSVMNSFPKRWQNSFMRGGAERYHSAKLETIQQHMVFEQAAEQQSNSRNDRVDNSNGRGRGQGRGRGRGGRWNNNRDNQRSNQYQNPFHPYNNNGGRGGRGGRDGRGRGSNGRGNNGRGGRGNGYNNNQG